MLLPIPDVLTADQVRYVRERLEGAGDAWVDGRATAGYQGAPVKRNQQIAEHSPVARELGDVIVAAIECNPLFISAALPNQVYPPLFNRYESGMTFGSHVDGAVRVLPNGVKLRTDVSATLFLCDPDEYDGGELVIEDTYGMHQVKLPAGHMVVYPATSLHQVTPVTRGTRLASFFWVQSLVRSDTQRALLFDMDTAIQRLNATGADDAARRSLVGCYHNLLRLWSET
ncbi:PKHD-type hydroxylase YbiX [Paraburkholderia kururiensis]|uniref:Fe2+-dependent dioxygenase n=1 Tax=Paraburkholderia kururiensis TaxID=984307 RepID=UPI0039A42EBC